MVQQQFDEVQEMLDLKERELQEAKEKVRDKIIIGLTDQIC